ncbi:MAG: toxic anion resistance protein, partial [Caldilineaceae bacterium]
VGQQAASSTINMEQLQRAFANIYETMDMISNYKLEALDSMQITVNTLATEVRKSQTYLDRVRNAEVIEVTGGMRIVESETSDQAAPGAGAAQTGQPAAQAAAKPAAPPVDDGTVKI